MTDKQMSYGCQSILKISEDNRNLHTPCVLYWKCTNQAEFEIAYSRYSRGRWGTFVKVGCRDCAIKVSEKYNVPMPSEEAESVK